jgi:hypothetical protein
MILAAGMRGGGRVQNKRPQNGRFIYVGVTWDSFMLAIAHALFFRSGVNLNHHEFQPHRSKFFSSADFPHSLAAAFINSPTLPLMVATLIIPLSSRDVFTSD